MPRPKTAAIDRIDQQVQVAAGLLVAVLFAVLLGPIGAAVASTGSYTYLLPEDARVPAGARVLSALGVADALLVTGPSLPPGAVDATTPLTFRSLGLSPHADGTQVDGGVRSTGATTVWETGNRGSGAVVALVDTGVAPVPALRGAVVGEIDFTGTGGGDPYGHGTFIASLIAARGPLAPGVAPDAGILSLKVGDAEGGTTLGMVLTALDWLDGPGRRSGIRIAALALGVDPTSPAAQILDAATDRLAEGDTLVITASGNDGVGTLSSPATATRTFSVGAFDQSHHDGPPASRPAPADFSGDGFDRAGLAQPDALTAGVSAMGHIDPTSVIGRNHGEPGAGGLLRGSGTSMATGLAAGVAALTSAARPDLGGTALDVALRNDVGVIDAPQAVESILAAPAAPAAPGNGKATAPGQAKKADAPQEGGKTTAPGQVAKTGDATLDWEIIRWKQVRWEGDRWQIIRWKGDAWQIIRWKAEAWSIIRWKAVEWNGSGWGDASWDGAALGGSTLDGGSWTIIRWKAEQWADASPEWTTIRWKGDAWTMLPDTA